ncbi:MAG: ferrous iron transport protein A [Acholeplasmatales bacterium]|nr:ferrous iron transport protein A [Acholeplasmatales bacterium]
MPLVIAPVNQEFKIIKILVSDEKVKKHLEALGIAPNQGITVLQVTDGNVIVKVKEGRLALDKHVAAKIVVA